MCGMVLFADIDVVVADAGAHKVNFDIKGGNAILPCGVLCQNVVGSARKHEIARQSAGRLVTICEIDISKFKCHTNETLRAWAQDLAAKRPVSHLS